MNIPTRDELTGVHSRIICIDGNEIQRVEASLAQLSWCTKWIATQDDYITVHEITMDTVANAYAAGYTKVDIQNVTNIPNLDEYFPNLETLVLINHPCTNVNFDTGQYSLNGPQARTAHMYTLMYHVCKNNEDRLAHIFHRPSMGNNNILVKPADISISMKAPNEEKREFIERPADIIKTATRIHIKNDNTLIFHVEKTAGHYECEFDVNDVTDIWPNRSGKLVDVFKNDQICGAGDIRRVRANFYYVQTGQWMLIDDPGQDFRVQDEMKKRNIERSIKCEKGMHGLVEMRRAIHDACGDHFVVQWERKRVSDRPLGIGKTFWSKLKRSNLMGNDLDNFIGRRCVNPYDDSNICPAYGKIEYLQPQIEFRPAQRAALNLMFRNNSITSGIYILPCGAGKTLLGIAATVRAAGKRTLVLVPNETIEQQWKKRFYDRARVRAKTLKELGRMSMNQIRTSPTPLVAVVSWNMLAWKCASETTAFDNSRLNPMKIAAVENALFCHWDLIIIDEVHNIRSNQNMCLLSKLSYSSMIGLTATATKEQTYPWQVDVVPVIYETAWPLRNAYIENYACVPWCENIFTQTADEIRGETKRSEHKNQRRQIKKQIFDTINAEGNVPTFMKTYEQMLELNPNKLATIEDIIDYHESNNQPIIVFANAVEHMKIFRRRFVTMPIAYNNQQHFGNYLRRSYEQYLYETIHKEYMEACGYDLDSYEDWQNNFVENWDHTADYLNIPRLMELCPNVPIDGYFAVHLLERLQAEEDALEKRVEKICKKPLAQVTSVTQTQYAELFFLFDTPRWVMFGEVEARNIPNQHRHHVYEKFKAGRIKTLFLTRIGNEGVDLPNARVIIIASGQGGSETETPQRFGRALRGVNEQVHGETKDGRFLYDVYTDTNFESPDLNKEKHNAENRETFLKTRGYRVEEKNGAIEMVHANNYIDNTFFMTAALKQQWADGRRMQLPLCTRSGDTTYDTLTIANNQCTYIRRQFEHDNNRIMAEYIADELGFEILERALRRHS